MKIVVKLKNIHKHLCKLFLVSYKVQDPINANGQFKCYIYIVFSFVCFSAEKAVMLTGIFKLKCISFKNSKTCLKKTRFKMIFNSK